MADVYEVSTDYLLGRTSAYKNTPPNPVSHASLPVLHEQPLWSPEYGWLLVNSIEKHLVQPDGNIIPFSVFSFLCVLLFEKLESLKNILMLGFAFSLIIELLQIPLYRGSDIDDLILNMVGYALGYLLYKIFLSKHKSLIKKIRP